MKILIFTEGTCLMHQSAKDGSSPSLRPAYETDNRELRAAIDKRRIPRKILENDMTRGRNPVHGCLWYRSVARSARIPCDGPGHRPKATGFASRTASYFDRMSSMPDMVFPSPG